MKTLLALLLLCSITLSAPAATGFIEAPGPSGPLKGSFVEAAPGAPVVLIIPGSGPTDRDGNNSRGLKAATYRLIAESLFAKGISSVRIDKRGMYASAGAIPDANAVTIADYVADTRAWIAAIRQRTGAKCVWLLGHSEGGLVALAAAADGVETCGLVLSATAGRPLADIIREQFKANPANAPLLDQAMQAIDSLAAGKTFDTAQMNPVLLPVFRPQVQKFLIDEMSYDPAQLIAKIRVPVLLLQGQRDLQVKEEDARRLAAADPQAKLVLLPDVNHVLKSVATAEIGPNVATYADPSLPLAPGVAEAVAAFVK